MIIFLNNKVKMSLKSLAIIPARYGSNRFPGKPLALLNNKPMIQYTYEAAKKAMLIDEVFVATDDKRIEKAVHNFGGNVIMTSLDCLSGISFFIFNSKYFRNNI